MIKHGVLRGFDGSAYTAAVQIAGSVGVWLTGVPVARNIPAGEMALGRRCALLFFSETNPQDAVLVAVYT